MGAAKAPFPALDTVRAAGLTHIPPYNDTVPLYDVGFQLRFTLERGPAGTSSVNQISYGKGKV